MNIELISEELKYYGASNVGPLLTSNEIEWFKDDLLKKKEEDIQLFGKDELLKNFSLETVSDLARFEGKYYDLISNPKINLLVDSLLNDKAVIHSYNAIIIDGSDKSNMVGHKFHRDMPWFPNCRTSIIIMIPLVDYNMNNGSTEYVKGTHLFPDMPSHEFLENYVVSTEGKAGEAFIIDSTTWHRAGKNQSGEARPMIVIKFTLAPFKQQIDFCSSNTNLSKASDIIKQRLGWNVRVPLDYIENRDWNQITRKFKSGQYDMKNTYLK
jgi:ectoine hydroxylase-related dioxygenase (phytanoyl-CoA dioxygenase family)